MMKKILLILLAILVFLPFFGSAENVAQPIKILLVPGHDKTSWGAQFGKTKEADMNLVLATEIYNLLKKDKRFEVYITRDKNGYTGEFAGYFATQKDNIIAFKQNAKKEIKDEIKNGTFVEKMDIMHNVVTKDMSVKLYGINKWANENKIDAVIHVHFNDIPRKKKTIIGKYTGFAIYTPEGQMTNYKGSVDLAKSIFSQLSKKYSPSTYKKEKGGIVPDQTLIAVGAKGTLAESVRSVLIEYGYIYQKIFRTNVARNKAYKNMAGLTTAGLVNYFFGN